MNAFFQEVGTIKTTMSNIRRNIKQIEEKYVQSLNSISIDQGSSISTCYCVCLLVAICTHALFHVVMWGSGGEKWKKGRVKGKGLLRVHWHLIFDFYKKVEMKYKI
jgi:hypothetical protein